MLDEPKSESTKRTAFLWPHPPLCRPRNHSPSHSAVLDEPQVSMNSPAGNVNMGKNTQSRAPPSRAAFPAGNGVTTTTGTTHAPASTSQAAVSSPKRKLQESSGEHPATSGAKRARSDPSGTKAPQDASAAALGPPPAIRAQHPLRPGLLLHKFRDPLCLEHPKTPPSARPLSHRVGCSILACRAWIRCHGRSPSRHAPSTGIRTATS
ncbi:hypothetical protein BV20DRAFT_122737 [Pilatotrama ljubarskyi]|nr:hypothetical protein BV20DRAFT_122737 [Pilatotrama ljubarskyi]